MDNLVLEAIVAEMRARLTGWPVVRLVSPAPDHFLVFFDDPARRLLASVAPELPRLHLTSGSLRRGEGLASPFVAAFTHHLTGSILASIEKDPSDRVVRLRFAGASGPGRSLVVELLGRSSNLLLLDGADRILGFARRTRAALRAPVLGAPYEPPERGGRTDPRSLAGAPIEAIVERSRRESHPLADLLLAACPALGPLAAKEIEGRTLSGEAASQVLGEWLARAFEPPAAGGDTTLRSKVGEGPDSSLSSGGGARGDAPGIGSPRRAAAARGFVYSEVRPDQLEVRQSPVPDRFVLSPLPLSSIPSAVGVFEYEALNDAADAYFGSLARGRSFRARRDGLAVIARREAKRADEASSKAAADLERMERAESNRVFGEALLAGLTRAETRGSEATVPDPYGAPGSTLLVPIDPALSLAANAERYFARYRKMNRGRAVARERLETQSKRRDRLVDLADRIVAASAEEDLQGHERSLRELGIAVGLERRPAARAEPRVSGVRIYTSSDGYEILVGKGAAENDRLTFKIASPEDFWLHASGASGAHVIVRNARVETKLPDATLREAAELAAFFSKAKDTGRAEVLVTRRKYVRRARGGPRGTVTVKKSRSIRAAARNPFE